MSQSTFQTLQGLKKVSDKAEQHKNTLLEFQKNSEKRTKVKFTLVNGLTSRLTLRSVVR